MTFTLPLTVDANLPWTTQYSVQDSFSPAQIADLTIWADAQDASTLTFNSTDISTWADKSGLGNNLSNSTGGQQPRYVASAINGKPALWFTYDANFQFLSVADNTTLDYTQFHLFTVFQPVTDQAGTETICGKFSVTSPANQREFRLIVSSGNSLQLALSQNGTAITTPADAGAVSVGTAYIADGSYNPTTGSLSLNNGTPATNTATAIFQGTSPFFVGTRDQAGEKFGGYVGEILFYRRALSASERSSVLNYLASKWGVVIA